jgi:hypothetical protein
VIQSELDSVSTGVDEDAVVIVAAVPVELMWHMLLYGVVIRQYAPHDLGEVAVVPSTQLSDLSSPRLVAV